MFVDKCVCFRVAVATTTWKFNHNANSFREAVGIGDEEIPESETEIVEAVMSGEERDSVRVAYDVEEVLSGTYESRVNCLQLSCAI